MRLVSDTEAGSSASLESAGGAGRAFVEALGRKDFEAAGALLDPEVDFRGLTPGRFWEASGASAVVKDVLTQWLDDSDDVEEVLSVETGSVSDRQRIAYRFKVRNPEGSFVFEQQVYFTQRAGRIDWMRVLCSGFRPE